MKTHDELGISAAERDGLIEVRDYLRGAGANTFEPEGKWDEHEFKGLVFNMATTCSDFECGTVACIGGSLALVLIGKKLEPVMVLSKPEQDEASAYVGLRAINFAAMYANASGIARLFYPHPIANWDAIRPEVAADAIDRFLETGDPDWVGIARERGIEIEEAFR